MLCCAALSNHVLKRGEAHVHYIADVYAQKSVRNHVKLMLEVNSLRGFSKGTVLCGGY